MFQANSYFQIGFASGLFGSVLFIFKYYTVG